MFDELLSLLEKNLVLQSVLSLVVIISAYLINKLLIKRAVNRFAKRAGLEDKYVKPVKSLGSLLIFAVTVILILWIFEIREAFFGLLAATGFAGIVIGMATRDIISDFLTGVLLLVYRPFEIGDAVTIGDNGGQVRDISIRGVTLRAWSGEIVVIPNSLVRTSIIKNFSVDKRRCDISILIDYDSDFTKALKICKRALEQTPEALKDPTPTLRVDDFKERYMEILILVWFPNEKFWEGYTKVKRKIAEGFRKQELKPPKLRVTSDADVPK